MIRTCFSALKDPTTIEPMETATKIGLKIIKTFKKTSNKSLIKNKSKQAFITIAKKAVIGLQIPSYTSATHTWHGKADILKKKAKKIKIKLNFISKIESNAIWFPRKFWISKKSREPTNPKRITIPKSKLPDAMAPNEKYLMADSTEIIPWCNKEAKTYNVKLKPSIVKYVPKKS